MEHNPIVIITLALLGLVAGSFAGASVWRLRARQLRLDKEHGDKIATADSKQVAKLHPKSLQKDRSICLHCGHQLAWYDLIPLVSWMMLGGKCRYCHKPIGSLEPLIEIGMAVFFVGSYLFWPSPLQSLFDITHFVIWIVAGIGLGILFVYDAKWFLLPNIVTFTVIGLGALNAVLVLIHAQFAADVVMSVFMSCLILSGLYYLLYILSRHQWVGFGDVKLGLALGLLLADWQLAILTLFLANFIGTVLFVPLLWMGKIKRQAHIPFGPLFISGWVIAGIFGTSLLSWYMMITLGV